MTVRSRLLANLVSAFPSPGKRWGKLLPRYASNIHRSIKKWNNPLRKNVPTVKDVAIRHQVWTASQRTTLMITTGMWSTRMTAVYTQGISAPPKSLSAHGSPRSNNHIYQYLVLYTMIDQNAKLAGRGLEPRSRTNLQ